MDNEISLNMKSLMSFLLLSLYSLTLCSHQSCQKETAVQYFKYISFKDNSILYCPKDDCITITKMDELIIDSETSDKICTKDACIGKTISYHKSLQKWICCLNQTMKETFPIDHIHDNYVRTVSNSLFSIVSLTPLTRNVRLVGVSETALSTCLDLDPKVANKDLFTQLVNGDNRRGLLPPALAHRYGGHQFGYWSGQLGDGRAALIGDFTNSHGERWELQLKGSGKTPYSRRGDGRAVVRSSVREYLASEAMHHLGVPTSRAAAMVVSDDEVARDQFYDGHPLMEKTAIVLRLAPSWLRIGSLEILSKSGEFELERKLLDYLVATFFKDINISDGDRYLALFSAVVKDTARLIAQWQAVGFAHGVLNTDNFSILSLTIDYGPFGFLDSYNPKFVPNSSDDEARYSFEKQPDVGFFNLEKLLRALRPVLDSDQIDSAYLILKNYIEHYKNSFLEIFTKKFGLKTVKKSEDEFLIATFLKILEDTQADYTMSFRQLGEIASADLFTGQIDPEFWALHYLSSHSLFPRFLNLYRSRLKADGVTDGERQSVMNDTNPVYILRNWVAQNAISAVEDDNFEYVHRLQKIFEKPFTRQPEGERLGLADKPPHWAGYLRVSCSS